jgi:hypothetical protein
MSLSLRCFNPQFYIASRLGDVALDQEVKLRNRDVDSQMRIVVKALTVLSAAVPTDDLRPADRLALDQLRALGEQAGMGARDGAKEARITSAEVDEVIQRLRRLRQEDPESADEILRRLIEETGTRPSRGGQVKTP